MEQLYTFLEDKYDHLIPWFITLIAMLLSFYSSIKSNSISRLAINKTILSKNREDWIRSFKDDISNLLALLAITKVPLATKLTESEFEQITKDFKERLFLVNKIKLSLNHKDPISNNLLKSLLLINEMDIDNLSNLSSEVMVASIKLIEQEWGKVDNLV